MKPSRSEASSEAGAATPSTISAIPAPAKTEAPTSSAKGPAPAKFPLEYLARQYLPDELVQQPGWAPVGVRLPRNDAVPQTLTIDANDPNLDSLSPLPVQHTPVVLFGVEPRWQPGQLCVTWDRGLAYATSKGKIRVIDRDTGTRILLRGHKADVVDLQVALEPDAAGRRTLASVDAAGCAIIWSVPDQCTEATAGFEKVVSIDGQDGGASFRLARIYPVYHRHPTVALVGQHGRVVFVDTQEAKALAAGSPDILKQAGTSLDLRIDVVDVKFSPDGSAFGVLCADGTISIRRTSNPSDELLSRQLDASPELSSFVWLSDSRWRPSAFAVASKSGTHLELISLHQSHQPQTSVRICLQPPPGVDEPYHFSRMAYHRPSNTLYLSASIRGSLFAFHLVFAASDAVLAGASSNDAGFLELLATSCTIDGKPPRVDHVTEVATDAPVLSFVLDDSIEDIDDNPALGALVAHPGGIDQVEFVRPRVPASEVEDDVDQKGSGDVEDDGGAGRRPSLESSITVSSEVETWVDEPDVASAPLEIPDTPALPAVGLARTKPEPVAVEPSEPTIKEEPAAAAVAQTGDKVRGGVEDESVRTPQAATPTSPKLADALASCALQDSTAKPKTKTKAKDRPSQPRASSSDRPGSDAGSKVDRSQTLVPTSRSKSGTRHEGSEGGATTAEVRAVLDALPGKVAHMVEAEFEKHVYRLEEQRVAERADEKARQETVLKAMNAHMTKHTNKLVEATIKHELSQAVLPALERASGTGMDEDVVAVIVQRVKEAVSTELSAVLSDQNHTRQIARNVYELLAPSYQRSVEQTSSTLLRQLDKGVQSCLSAIKSETVAVRKDIVKEYAVEQLESEVKGLRSEVGELRESLSRMEALMQRMGAERAAAVPVPAAAPLAAPEPQQAMVPARPLTPLDRYDEQLTNLLLPQHEPAFTELRRFIAESSAERLHRIMPSQATYSAISPAVTLSLALRLSQIIGNDRGPVDVDTAKQMAWLGRCLGHLSPSQPEVVQFGQSILGSVVTALRIRIGHLQSQGDASSLAKVQRLTDFADNVRQKIAGGRA